MSDLPDYHLLVKKSKNAQSEFEKGIQRAAKRPRVWVYVGAVGAVVVILAVLKILI